MLDANRFYSKVSELEKEKADLNEKRATIISEHKEEIEKRTNEEFKEFIKNNEERITKEVIGKELEDIDEKISINDEILQVLKGFEVEEPEETTTETTEEIIE